MATLHPASILMGGVSEDATLSWLILKNKVKENIMFKIHTMYSLLPSLMPLKQCTYDVNLLKTLDARKSQKNEEVVKSLFSRPQIENVCGAKKKK